MVLRVIFLQRHVRTQIQTHNLLFPWYSPDHIMTLCPLFTVCVGGKSFSLHVSLSFAFSLHYTYSSKLMFVILPVLLPLWRRRQRERQREERWVINTHIYSMYDSTNGNVLPMNDNPSCFCSRRPLRWTQPLLMDHCTEGKPCKISLDCHYWIYWY